VTPVAWTRVKAIVAAAIDLPPEARDAFVREAAAGDEALAAEVASLLAAHGAATTFLEQPAGAAFEPPRPPLIGRVLGAYRIVREIGHGGMGAVFHAVRDDREFEKNVAIKVAGTGLPTAAAVARFRHERQILAALEHPNIARLLDGGTTPDGLPYVVMELVNGEPIDVYCTERRLGVAARLRLFATVCRAVHYAHQNLVVHRDIKPGNILVTPDGTPKLLDFGIAKLLEDDASARDTDAASREHAPTLRMLTPECASPEQVRGEPITTASDVYSLGVLLCRLLSGALPYRVDRPTPHAVARAVCDQPPEKPSALAADRSLRRQIAGDLDTIALKALHKEPQRRYLSAEQLAEDIDRHLDGRPVEARPDTVAYRTAKFVRRHKAGVAAAALVTMSLITGLAAATYEAHVAEQQRARAERRFADVRQMANSFLFEVHDAVAALPGATAVRALVLNRAVEYLDRLAADAGDDPSVQRELATAYERIGDVEGRLRAANLGQTAQARASYQKALAIREALVRAAPNDLNRLAALAASYERISEALFATGDVHRAVDVLRKRAALVERIAAARPNDFDARVTAAMSHGWLGYMLGADGEPTAGLKECRDSLARLDALMKLRPDDDALREQRAKVLNYTGDVLQNLDPREAVATHEQELALRQQLLARAPSDPRRAHGVVEAYSTIGDARQLLGEPEAALDAYERARGVMDDLARSDPRNVQWRSDLTYLAAQIATLLAKTGRPAEALRLLGPEAATAQQLRDADPRNAIRQLRVAWCEEAMGHAHAALATARGLTAAARKAHWSAARAWYEKSETIWLQMNGRGASSGLEAAQAGVVREAIAQCDSELGRSGWAG
jgi:non-specific serine/threonine protein kinase/serine/threonine-protein kinase